VPDPDGLVAPDARRVAPLLASLARIAGIASLLPAADGLRSARDDVLPLYELRLAVEVFNVAWFDFMTASSTFVSIDIARKKDKKG
jgi:hypothetical protein